MKNFINSLMGKAAKDAVVVENGNMSFCFLTVGKVSDTTTTAAVIKRYVGIGTCTVLAVNPTAAEIEKHMGFKPQNEPEYLGTDQNGNKTARITLIVKTVPEDCNGIDITAFLSFNMTATIIKGSTSGKIQVMDAFNNTAWGDEDVVNANKPIIYKDGRNPLIGAYKKVCRGEVALNAFLRAYLGILSATNYINGSFVAKTGQDLENAKLCLEDVQNYFKGNFSEVKDAIALMPNNKVKLLFGVRTNDEGKQFQDVNAEVFMSARSNSTKTMEKVINEAKAAGRYANTEYDFNPIHEYNPQPTEFKAPESDDLPFSASSSSTPW